MRQLVVLSGKGGTGKTTVAAALAHLAAAQGRTVLVDADVDAPNLGLILRPRVLEKSPFYGGRVAEIDPQVCTGCGLCAELCRFEAVVRGNGCYRVDAIACEGCAACAYGCPEDAIAMSDRLSGRAFHSETRFGRLFHAELAAGEGNSGKLVSAIKQQALAAARETEARWLIVDGAPGIGCPVIAALSGADAALLVCEPTVSGLHDLRRILALVRDARVLPVVCINKCDLSPDIGAAILAHCRAHDAAIAGELPYDDIVPRAMRHGLAVTEMGDPAWCALFERLWAAVQRVMRDAAALEPHSVPASTPRTQG